MQQSPCDEVLMTNQEAVQVMELVRRLVGTDLPSALPTLLLLPEMSKWIIGDLLNNHNETKHTNAFKVAEDTTGLSYRWCSELARVARTYSEAEIRLAADWPTYRACSRQKDPVKALLVRLYKFNNPDCESSTNKGE